jgi:hypothetical protein
MKVTEADVDRALTFGAAAIGETMDNVSPEDYELCKRHMRAALECISRDRQMQLLVVPDIVWQNMAQIADGGKLSKNDMQDMASEAYNQLRRAVVWGHHIVGYRHIATHPNGTTVIGFSREADEHGYTVPRTVVVEPLYTIKRCNTCEPNGVFDTEGNGPYDCYACGKKATI